MAGVEDFTAGVEDFTAVVGSTVEAGSVAVDFMAAGFAAGVASEAEWDSAAAAGFVAARSAEERDFAEGEDFAVEGSAAAFAVTVSVAAVAGAGEVGEDEAGVGEVGIGTIGGGASVLAGAGLIGVGDTDMAIRTDIGTTRGRRLITRPAMIPTTIITTTLRPPARIEIIHTGTTGT
jgi:hypothetical protein